MILLWLPELRITVSMSNPACTQSSSGFIRMQKFRATKLAHHHSPVRPKKVLQRRSIVTMWRDREQRRVVSSDCARVLVLPIAVKGPKLPQRLWAPTGGPKACTEFKMLSKTACWADETTPLCVQSKKASQKTWHDTFLNHRKNLVLFLKTPKDFTTNCTLVQMNTTIKWR